MRVRRPGLFALFTLIALFLPTTFARAQSMYLERGTSGFGIGGSFMTADEWNGFGLGAGYSLSGLVDLGFGFSRISLEDSDLTGTGLSPSISVCALKQSTEMPLSLELGVAYEHDSYDSDALDLLGWDMSGSGYSFGLSVYGSIQASPSMNVLPIFGLAYVHTNVEVEDSYGQSVSDDDDSTSFGFGLSLAFPMARKQVFYLTPGLSIVEDETSFRVSAGFVFPTHGSSSI